MAIKKFKPTSPALRQMTVLVSDEITCNQPEKSLLVSLKKNSGRNAQGKITVRHRGGGNRRKYRIIDFKRNKDGIPAKVATIEYDPNRTANIALLHYVDGEKAYILAPVGLEVGTTVLSGPTADIKPGNALALKDMPVGTVIHNIELKPGKGANEYEFPGDDTPIIRGSALMALENPASEWGDKIVELFEQIDAYIPEPERDVDKNFLMPVEDVFSITGRGTVATGRVERGILKVQDEVEIVGLAEEPRKVVVTGVEMFRKLLDQAQAGDNIGALIRGVQRNEIERGQVMAKPGTVKPHTKFMAEVYVLKKEEGGRHTPFFDGYRPQFYFRTTDVTGACKLPEGIEMVMPGDNVTMTVELINSIAIEEGLRFAIREGGRTVASGVVASIVE